MIKCSNSEKQIIETVLAFYPDIQAIYIFGTYGTEDEWADSDIDIALLLPHKTAKEAKNLLISDCRYQIENIMNKKVDLLNLRLIATVFQKEVIAADRMIFCQDKYAADEFEMLTISYYQKLNEERHDILQSFYETKRAYPV
jgi:predicted nucleotidyltransferase